MVRSSLRPFKRTSSLVVALALSWSAAASVAHADDTPTLRWNPKWTRFTTTQYVLTGAMGAGLLATDRFLEPAAEARWRGNILLDGPAHSLLAAGSPGGRKAASTVSDYLALGVGLYPFVVDAVFVAGAHHHSYDVAYQMVMISLQGMLLAKLVTGLTKDLVGRARPDAGSCAEGNDMACSSENESFVSGHTAGAFTGAGLICAHHQNLDLYGDGPGGAIACGVGLGAATAVGALRVVAGRHHLSDVLAGAAIGLGAGYLLPNVINYDFGKSKGEDGTIMPMAGKGTFGLTYMRTW